MRYLSALVVGLLFLAGAAHAADPLQGIRIQTEANVDYNRTRDYGGWLTPERCMSTRMIVLRDESEPARVRIKTKPNGSCDVWAGRWHEPYVGYITTDPRRLQIDHLVPLKEAHRSGAFRWSKARRKAYANDVTNEWHLLATDASANMAKGDKDPARWLPPNHAFRCAYLAHWIEVKRRWNLTMDQIEAGAIRVGLSQCN